MGRTVILVVPEAPPTQAAGGGAPRPRLATDGVRLGVLDNSKGNADHLLAFLVEGVRAADVPVKSVVSLRKGSVSLPAPAAMLDRLEREADVVVSAMGD
ncbi:MAG: hypothetical protein IT529_04115 [Burkholderiales bacterium]|nr:hypothetical protein [Burkholderiales bacterium]